MKTINFLGIDFGEKKIGIAIYYFSNNIVLPFSTIDNNEKLFSKIIDIIDNENITKIIIGYPITFNNYISERHEKILSFRKKLNFFLKDKTIKIYFQDESYSSQQSEKKQNFYLKNKKVIKKNKDSVSAQIILERYIDLNR